MEGNERTEVCHRGDLIARHIMCENEANNMADVKSSKSSNASASAASVSKQDSASKNRNARSACCK